MNTFKRFTTVIFAAVALLLAGACTRIETGHVGVRYSFNGQIEPQELPVGWHQTLVGTVKNYVANEMTINLDNLHPQTKDRSTLSDLDLSYTYSVAQGSIADLIVKYKGRDLYHDNDIYPLGQYVSNVVTTATSDVFAHYDALQANERREQIREEIKAQVSKILKEEGIEQVVKVHQIFVKNLQIDKGLQASALSVITAQNDLKAKDFEVQTAQKEAQRLQMLAANRANIDYMNAKSLSDIAEGIKAGRVHTIVVPYDFKGIVNVK